MGVFNFLRKKKKAASVSGQNDLSQKSKDYQGVEEISQKQASADVTDEQKPQVMPGSSAGIDFKQALSGVDKSKLSFKEKVALKMFEKMPRKKQEDILRQAMNPQTIMNMKPEDKAKMKKQFDDAVKSGMIPKGQAEAMKNQMGLR